MLTPHLIPIAFGLAMATVDIVMMSIVKLVSLGSLPYIGGLIAASAIYALQPILFAKALTFETMTAANLIWNMTSSVIVTLIGVFYFGEPIKGLRWVAVALALFSIALFAYTDS